MKANTARSSHTFSMVVLSSLFFMWGFITVLNDILIPYLKAVFELSYFQAMLVQFAFFGAYFVGGLVYYLISVSRGDPINRIGYKNGILIGLLVSAIGTFLFYPAAALQQYALFLSALFVLGLGFAVLQIAANPYVAILGPESQASARLNLSQGFNSIGTTVGPVLGGFLIFEYFHVSGGNAAAVIPPYLALTGLLVVLGLLVYVAPLPPLVQTQEADGAKAGALRYPHLILGALAIFLYVGAEVSIGSFLVSYLGLPQIAGMAEGAASAFIAFYWGGAMIGRFLGAVSMSNIPMPKKYALMAALSAIAFGVVFWVVNVRYNIDFHEAMPYIIFLILNYLAFVVGKSVPSRTLTVFALFPVGLLMVAIFMHGALAMWSLLAIGIFNSIMWSNIFTLAIKGLGKDTSQGSSILVMFIVGGALLPPLQGLMADYVGVQFSFFVPVLSYLYLAWYGWIGCKVRPAK